MIPLLKKAHAKEVEDYRLVALTSMHLSEEITGRLNPLQFVYNVWCGVEDATLPNKATKHLDLVSYYVSNYVTKLLLLFFSHSVHLYTLETFGGATSAPNPDFVD